MFYVYIIRSETHQDQTYVGFTEDLRQRLATHNQGGSSHTAKFVPWQFEFYCAFRL
jgi:putative endonuclease